MLAQHRSLSAPWAAVHAGITGVVLLSGSSPALLPNYQVTKRPCESLLEKNVLQKLNLTQSQKHILGFTTQRSRERRQAKKQISSLPRSKAFCPEKSMCREGCEQRREGAAWRPGLGLEIPAMALAAGALRWDIPAQSQQALQSHQCLSFPSGRDPAPGPTFWGERQSPLGMDPDTS